jgi:hypothetical protein
MKWGCSEYVHSGMMFGQSPENQFIQYRQLFKSNNYVNYADIRVLQKSI